MTKGREIFLVASGDLRPSANEMCWPAQAEAEKELTTAIEKLGYKVRRAHPYIESKKHGFIDSQRYGIEVFSKIPSDAPVIVAEAVWQYSHHVFPGLFRHEGPILTVANWSGQWPGLVGMMNLNGGLTKAGVPYSTLWSKDFRDDYFLSRLKKWLEGKKIRHDESHVKPYRASSKPSPAEKSGVAVAEEVLKRPAILGVFDEGCMGMYNAIVPDELLHPLGMFKERLSQSALFAAMRRVPDDEARAVRQWLDAKGMTFRTGKNGATELTDEQVFEQCRMYVAVLRIAADFGCDAVGIQYQQGLKDICPASDLVEGLLNNVDRPPVKDANGKVLYEGDALPHFNEVDECAGIDALITNRVWRKLGLDPETTLHDLRFGEEYDGQFVWILEISGAAPAQHFANGYKSAISERQPPMYFPLGGGSLKGVSKPGEIVWSRVYVQKDKLLADVGRATVVDLPREEVERRWQATTPQWPMMNAVLHGVSQNQMMGRHKANHIQVAYARDTKTADKAMLAKAAAFKKLGVEVFLCGVSGKS
jgi:L-fucose isomerase-like protein